MGIGIILSIYPVFLQMWSFTSVLCYTDDICQCKIDVAAHCEIPKWDFHQSGESRKVVWWENTVTKNKLRLPPLKMTNVLKIMHFRAVDLIS